MPPLEDKRTPGHCLIFLGKRPGESTKKCSISFRKRTCPPDWCAHSQQTLVTPVQNKSEALVSYPQHAGRARHASRRGLKSSLDQFTLVTEHFIFQRTAGPLLGEASWLLLPVSCVFFKGKFRRNRVLHSGLFEIVNARFSETKYRSRALAQTDVGARTLGFGQKRFRTAVILAQTHRRHVRRQDLKNR